MKRARFTAAARAELLAQTAYYEALRAELGVRFRSEVETAVQRSVAFPAHGAPAGGQTRRRRVANFPFTVVYTESEEGILVHAVAHERRFPEYWADDGTEGKSR